MMKAKFGTPDSIAVLQARRLAPPERFTVHREVDAADTRSAKPVAVTTMSARRSVLDPGRRPVPVNDSIRSMTIGFGRRG
ncbi:hypothetical protein APR12_003281 [Nocardia amikacinitolerans]|nr:hypothetical protein [Nocardia amikacinitolerans]